jgi:Secretion system C-terminal sorting domain
MKRILIMSLILSLSSGITFSQTILQPGDIAIVGYNFKDPDEFSFITFVDLDPGTIIYFTDCGWTSSNNFRVGEGIVTYTVPAGGKAAGSVVTFGLDPGFTTAGVSGFFGLSIGGDQLLVYQGSFAAPQFIYALNNNGGAVWQTSASDNNTSALPPGLVNGYSAVALIEKEDGEYNCSSMVKDKNQLLPLISDFNNWTGDNDNRYSLPPSCFLDPLSQEIIEVSAEIMEDFLTVQLTVESEGMENYLMEISTDYIQYDSFATLKISENRILYSFHFPVTKNYASLKLKSEKSGKVYGPVIIDVQTEQKEISIYPNPYTKGVLEITNLDEGKTYYLQISNLSGQIILNGSGSEEHIKEELQKFAASTINGIYFVILRDKIKIYHEKLLIE